MKLSIITINYNNAAGLQKTMESVLNQTSQDFEYIVIDGASTDGSVEYLTTNYQLPTTNYHFVSESDNGIYHAMNKGIRMAKGEYVQFLNSGDVLAAPDVTERMLNELGVRSRELEVGSCEMEVRSKEFVNIMYGNMLKPYKGKVIHDRGFAGRMPTMLDFYTGTLNHSCAYIKRSLFDTYGLYDESLNIVSDWKWYLSVVVMHNVVPVYKNIDVSVFDMNGISNTNSTLDKAERRKVLEELLPLLVLRDYDQYATPINQLKRINRYWVTRKGFWLVERVLFKWEKWFKNKEQVF